MPSSFFSRSEIKIKEQLQEVRLWEAFEKSRKRHSVTRYEKTLVEAHYSGNLIAVNPHSRILWNEVLSKQLSNYFCDGGDGEEHNQDIYFVTLLDHHCARSPSTLLTRGDFQSIRRRLCYGLRGLDHLSAIEPAYYRNLQAGFRYSEKESMFWHLHGLVWGISLSELKARLGKLEINGRYLAIADGFSGTRCKLIQQGDLPKVTGYTFKSPAVCYRVSVRDREENGQPVIDENGEVLREFIQGKSELRHGERITLFHAMKNLYLDQLTVAGGEGSALLARAKRSALST